MPDEIETIARDWTADADNVFDKVVAIEERLRNSGEFRYLVDTSLRAGPNSILEFLTETRAGFCQQFSATMAAMLRSIGIQSRVVVGWTAGSPVSEGQFSITTKDAHAWVEVYFPGWGWMPFEPTPGRTNPVSYVPVDETCSGPDCEGPGSPADPSTNSIERREATDVENSRPGGGSRGAGLQRPSRHDRRRGGAAVHQRQDGSAPRRDRRGPRPPARSSVPRRSGGGSACAGPRPSPGG